MTKRTIYFYGDSNTWGWTPGGGRIPAAGRFVSVAAAHVPDSDFVANGLNGRNAAFECPDVDPIYNGGATFAAAFKRELPVSALVLMLGTNDVMPPLDMTAEAIGENLRRIIREARALAGAKLPILLVSPPPPSTVGVDELAANWGSDRAIVGRNLAPALRQVAREEGVAFVDGSAAQPTMDSTDGFHLTHIAHRRVGVAIGQALQRLLGCAPTPRTSASRL